MPKWIIGRRDIRGDRNDLPLRSRPVARQRPAHDRTGRSGHPESNGSGVVRSIPIVPLIRRAWQAGHAFADIIENAGGIDVATTLPRQAFLDAERITALQPDVIVIIGASAAKVQTPQRLMATPALAAVPAIRTRRVYASPPGFSGFMMTSLELPIYARWLADILHPDELPTGARELATRLYSEAFGAEPTATELDEAFAAQANSASAGAYR